MTTNPTRLRFLYAFNLVGAGVPGALITFFPEWARAAMFTAPQDASMLGMLGAIWFAIGLVSAVGLRFPQTFKGLFIMQMLYKTLWIAAVAVPLLLQGRTADVGMYVVFFLGIILAFGIGLFGDSNVLKKFSEARAGDMR